MLPLGCAPWRAASALPAVSIETSGEYKMHGAVVSTAFARVGPQQPRAARACFLLVSYSASLALGLCELVLAAAHGLRRRSCR